MNQTGQSQFDQARLEWALKLLYSPFPELNMQMLSQQLNAFRIGDHQLIGRTWEIMLERDAELQTAAHKRFQSVASLEWQIVSDGSPEGDAHAAALQYLYDHCRVTECLAQDSIGDVSKLVYNLATAHANYYDVHEMLLRVDNPAAREATYEFRHTPIWFFESRRGYLGFLQHIFDLYGQPLRSGEWLAAVGHGYMRSCAILYAMKHFALVDWLLFSKRIGIPWQHWTTDAGKDSKEWNDILDMIARLANDSSVLTNEAVKCELIEAAGKPDQPFEPLVERADRGYDKLFRGTDTASSMKQSTGSQPSVGVSGQDGEKDILLDYDAKWATPILNDKVDRPHIRYLFGVEPRAWIKILGPGDPEDVTSDIAVDQFLITSGVRLGVKDALERYDRTEAAAGEEVLKAPVVPNADGSTPSPGGEGRGEIAPSPKPPAPSKPAKGPEFVSGARPNNNPQMPDPRMPDADKPMTRFNFPSASGAAALANESAQAAFAAAAAEDIGHVLDRLHAIRNIQDDDLMLRKLRQFLADYPQLEKDILADPAAARALQPIIATALGKGLAGQQP